MGKDKAVGGVLLIACVFLFLVYTYYSLIVPAVGNILQIVSIPKYWVTAIPLWIGITVILFIGAWIGWTLLTTPAPEPLVEPEETVSVEGTTEEKEESQ